MVYFMNPQRGGKTIKRSKEMIITKVKIGCDVGEHRKLEVRQYSALCGCWIKWCSL